MAHWSKKWGIKVEGCFRRLLIEYRRCTSDFHQMKIKNKTIVIPRRMPDSLSSYFRCLHMYVRRLAGYSQTQAQHSAAGCLSDDSTRFVEGPHQIRVSRRRSAKRQIFCHLSSGFHQLQPDAQAKLFPMIINDWCQYHWLLSSDRVHHPPFGPSVSLLLLVKAPR